MNQQVMDLEIGFLSREIWDRKQDWHNLIDDNTLDYVRKLVSVEYFKEIQQCIIASEDVHQFRVKDKACSSYLQDDGFENFSVYLDQYEDGGYTGDSFAGYVSIPLPNDRFLQFHYSM